jgi:DNA polymerase-4
MEDVHRVLLNISDQVARRLRKHEKLSQGIQITIRTPDMKTITRSRMMEVPTEDATIIYREACALFAKHWSSGKPVRMLGVTLQNLIPREESAVQLDLFEYEQKPKKENLIRIMDQLRDKFGENAVVTAGMLGDDPSVLLRNHKVRGTSLQKDNLQSPD